MSISIISYIYCRTKMNLWSLNSALKKPFTRGEVSPSDSCLETKLKIPKQNTVPFLSTKGGYESTSDDSQNFVWKLPMDFLIRRVFLTYLLLCGRHSKFNWTNFQICKIFRNHLFKLNQKMQNKATVWTVNDVPKNLYSGLLFFPVPWVF